MTHTEIIAPDHPGSFIEEELEARGWAKGDLAYILGIAPESLSRILNGKTGISAAMAIALGDAFGIPAEFFANLQKLYDLDRAQKPDPGVRTRAVWSSHFPVREMLNRGWIDDSEPSLLHLQMLRFFGKSSVEDIPFIGTGRIDAHAARKSGYAARVSGYESMTELQYVWLNRVKKVAEQMDCPQYSREKFVETLPKVRAHMLDIDDLHIIPEILRECGVRLVFVEAFASSRIDGVCVWLNDQPVIGMSLRLDKFDNFCFTLRHEVEHVLQEHGKDVGFMPVDEKLGCERENVEEEEQIADRAAQEFLVPAEALRSFIARKAPYISERDVLAFSTRMQIHPAVVVGQIQHALDKWNWLKQHIVKVRDRLISWEQTDGWGKKRPTGL
jgi:HTH-type transcriptional regulator / antitoxin HigA